MRLLAPLLGLVLVALAAYAPGPPPADPMLAPADTTWGWPESPANLQVLPADTSPERLRAVMQGFTRSLGVRCQFCHVGEPGADFLTWDFAADAKPMKGVAREMMQMTWAINTETLPDIHGLRTPDDDGWRVTCWTCHRGDRRPERERPGDG